MIDESDGAWVSDGVWEIDVGLDRWSIVRLGGGRSDSTLVVTRSSVPLRTPSGRERRFRSWDLARRAIYKETRTLLTSVFGEKS